MKNKCGTVKNEKVTQEVLANFFLSALMSSDDKPAAEVVIEKVTNSS